jgi:predicted nucleic acid-binding protein
MKSIIVDTDILINFLRGKKCALNFLVSAMEEADLCCSALTVGEIHAGMKEHEREHTEELFDSLTVVDVTRAIGEKAGSYKRAIKSQNLALNDCIIAATAFMIHAVLATGNDKHYPMLDIEKVVVRDKNR